MTTGIVILLLILVVAAVAALWGAGIASSATARVEVDGARRVVRFCGRLIHFDDIVSVSVFEIETFLEETNRRGFSWGLMLRDGTPVGCPETYESRGLAEAVADHFHRAVKGGPMPLLNGAPGFRGERIFDRDGELLPAREEASRPSLAEPKIADRVAEPPRHPLRSKIEPSSFGKRRA